MTGFDAFNEAGFGSDFDPDDSAISMFDEDGNEAGYHVLVTKKDGDCLFMLMEEELPDDTVEELVAEVLIFKCISGGGSASSPDPEEMIFELVDEDHPSFERAFSLFKEDFDSIGIEYE